MSQAASGASGPPVVSVVIPCHDPGAFLLEAVESALSQSHPGIEVVVADDGSSQDVRTLLRPFDGVRYVRQSNRGVAAARNLGARESTGHFLVFLDADDRLLPDAVATGLRHLSARPDAAFASGLCYPVDAGGRPLPFHQQPEVGRDCYEEMLGSNFIWMPAQVLYRRTAFEASGGFDSSVDACADYDLYLRITRTSPVVLHRELVAEYRTHAANMSRNKALMLASALRVLERQWPYAKATVRYRRAYQAGRRFWREYYGEQLVEEIRADIKSRRAIAGALRGLGVLLRHNPVEVARQLGRKIRRLLVTPSRNA